MSTSCASGTSTNTQTRAPSTSTVVQNGPDNNTSQQETVYGDYPMALVVLSGNHDDSRKDVEQCFPGKTIASVDDWKLLKKNWHLFTAILIDVGKPTTPDGNQKVEGAVSACLKNMYEKMNVALLMPIPAAPLSAFESRVYQLAQSHRIRNFQYSRESGGRLIFDDGTKNRMVHWLGECSDRYASFLESSPDGLGRRIIGAISSAFGGSRK
eukprot:XP_011675279.1 PREDICTED: uncharacterized protein LOC105443619 [Strongylocentrotus purpuratus]